MCAMDERPPPGLAEAVEEAARSLHDPALAKGEIVGLLERAVIDLSLAAEARFIPRAQASDEDDPDVELVPLHRSGGNARGVLRCRKVATGATWPLRLLVSHAAAALDARARAREARRRERALRAISEELQDSLLTPLPTLEATTIDVAYRAASAEARVGGDFYDAFTLPGGRVLIVVGDVMGKGVQAASHTARITHTLRALALQGLELDEMLERCDEQVRYQDPGLMATVWCGLYEPATGELEFGSLGHPPALLVRADGDPISLSLEGLPLGLRDLSEQPPELRTRLLQTRDLLVLYTDGVVEASGDYVAGQKALLAAVERRRDDPLSTIIQGVLDEMLGGAGHRDDAVLLLLRRR